MFSIFTHVMKPARDTNSEHGPCGLFITKVIKSHMKLHVKSDAHNIPTLASHGMKIL